MSRPVTMTLTGFLLARIAEDEDMPEAMSPEAIWLRRRVLRECEAKRRIVDYRISEGYADDGMVTALRALAAIYADHPDYREEWRP